MNRLAGSFDIRSLCCEDNESDYDFDILSSSARLDRDESGSNCERTYSATRHQAERGR